MAAERIHMPVLVIYGINPRIDTTTRKNILHSLQMAVASVEELGVRKDEVGVFMPSDLIEEGLGEEIVVHVSGIVTKSDSNPDVLHRLAAEIGTCLKVRYFRDADVKCFVFPSSPSNSWSSVDYGEYQTLEDW